MCAAACLVEAVQAACRAHGGGDYDPEWRFVRAGQDDVWYRETFEANPALKGLRCVRRARAICHPRTLAFLSQTVASLSRVAHRFTELDFAMNIKSSRDLPPHEDGSPAHRVPVLVFKVVGGHEEYASYNTYEVLAPFVDLPPGFAAGASLNLPARFAAVSRASRRPG